MKYMEKLIKYNQQHLLKFENELTESEKQELYNQIDNLDFSYLEELNKPQTSSQDTITPIKAMTIEEIQQNKEEFTQIGLNALKQQKIGALLLAGGMGTRLGSDKPKGMYNIGKTKDVFIFQRIFENLLDVVKLCGKSVPFFIMTSEHNNSDTINFLKEHNYFGYDPNYVKFFTQEMAPCVDFNGKILLEAKNRVATSPNGNGGWFTSLIKNDEARKMLEDFKLEYLNIFAVDNVLQKVADPTFIGAVLSENYEIGAKVIKKVDAFEKVGVMCTKNSHPGIVEYIDLPEHMALETDERGERVYNFGTILNNLLQVKLLNEIKDKKLPIHVVTKRVEHIDEFGNLIKPETPNAHKFEMLWLDMFDYSSTCLPFEVERRKEFAPIKNKTGVDSVESAQALLEENGYEL
ncbi:MAG: UTP--glucose-1-phosphate uridylyltransferase [Clostridia bacterium]|nr:UTP--glucose-1-phosphate uridylyltransferase [Clostridia bacterium]